MTNELSLHTVNEEARVLDTDLAERLGMVRPTNIRSQIIKSHRAELETYGELCTEAVQTGGWLPSSGPRNVPPILGGHP